MICEHTYDTTTISHSVSNFSDCIMACTLYGYGHIYNEVIFLITISRVVLKRGDMVTRITLLYSLLIVARAVSDAQS
jgi:hypothetical protein